MNETVLCEKCGNEMVYFQEKHSCGWTCPVCGDGVVTTHLKPIERDQTIYSIFTDTQEPSLETIKIAAKVFGCNYLEARKGLSEGLFSISGEAKHIQKKAKILKEGNISFHIEPDFPYSIGEE